MTDGSTRPAALVEALDHAFDRPSWHGPTLDDALRGLTVAAASWRPAAGMHNAWELVVHADYWTCRGLQHVAAAPPPAFTEAGANFFARPAEGASLEVDIQRLRDHHSALRDAAAALDVRRLDAQAYGVYTIGNVLAGVAAHHVYHAGQIQFLNRLYEASQPSLGT